MGCLTSGLQSRSALCPALTCDLSSGLKNESTHVPDTGKSAVI